MTTHDNHFVPQWYLRQWADADGKFWRYRLLVPHESCPHWEERPVRGVAFERDLYTVAFEGRDDDDFERWIKREYEDPGQAAVQKAIDRRKLCADDWQRLALFAACQDLRTPQHYLEFMEFMRGAGPDVMKSIAEGVQGVLRDGSRGEAGRREAPDERATAQSAEAFSDAVKVSIRRDLPAEDGQVLLGLHMLVGRDMWMREQRHLLESVGKAATSHSSCIAEAAKGFEWFTSDHPVVRLQYYEGDAFDVSGAWAKTGTNILMPLSRRYLLYCQVGSESPSRLRLTKKQTSLIRRAIAMRAHRSIFALRPVPDIAVLRRRLVDLDGYSREREQWEGWHGQQTEAERAHALLPKSLQDALAADDLVDDATDAE